MKINGRKLSNNNLEYAVIPRNDGNQIFTFKPILDSEVFNTLCPMPKPGFISDEKGQRENTEDPGYQKKFLDYLEKRQQWMFLESISATPGLEWEQVKLDDPETWGLYSKELTESGITDLEFRLLREAFEKVNCLNEAHLEEARESFLATLRQKEVPQ